jgi:MscS family membrane protein
MKIFAIFAAIFVCVAAATASPAQSPPPADAQSVVETADTTRPHKAQPTFGLDRVGFFQREVMGYPLWQYGASLLWVILAFVAAAVVDRIMTRQLRKLAAKTRTQLDDKLIEVGHKPIKVIVFLAVLQIGVQMFAWPDWAEKLFSGLFAVVIAGAVAYLLVKLVDVSAVYIQEKFFAADVELAKLFVPILSKSLKVFIVIIAVLTTAQYMGLPITSVIAGLGIGGLAVALAAQNTLANVFGSLTILADRPFRVGERVVVDKYDGSIESIGLRSTRLRTLEGHLVTIPNKIMADVAICNISRRPNIRHLMTLSITYGTPADKMREAVDILRDIFTKHPLTHDAWIYWRDYGPHSLDIFIVYWCKATVFKEFLQALEEINLEIKQRFDAAGIEFAFPTQTIHLANPPDWPRP